MSWRLFPLFWLPLAATCATAISGCSGDDGAAVEATEPENLLARADSGTPSYFMDAGGGPSPTSDISPADGLQPMPDDAVEPPGLDSVADTPSDDVDDTAEPLDAVVPEPDTGPPPPQGAVPPNINVTTYINLGDSAGEGCCTPGGNKWAYFEMLTNNDDAKYPQWAGSDLPATWATVSEMTNWADSGDTSGDVKKDQLPKFAPTYASPVIVTIHVGGNDFNDHKIMDFLAKPAQIAADGELLESNLSAVLSFFENPARFPAGAFVFVANIFSPTDDTCGFEGKPAYDGGWCDKIRSFGCLAPAWVEQLKAYNTHIANAVAGHPSATLVDTHAAFLGHGMNFDDPAGPHYIGPGAVNYFNTDCVHPNAAGHHAIRAAFFEAMTGMAP